MFGSKNWYHSTAIWGSIVSALSIVIGLTKGVQIDANMQAQIVDQVVTSISLGGALIGNIAAIYGRLAATQLIK
jgi:hypothetical protein